MEECISTTPFYVVLCLMTVGAVAMATLIVMLSRMVAKSEKMRIEAEYDSKRYQSELEALQRKFMG